LPRVHVFIAQSSKLVQTGLRYINFVRGSPAELLHTQIVNVNEIALYMSHIVCLMH